MKNGLCISEYVGVWVVSELKGLCASVRNAVCVLVYYYYYCYYYYVVCKEVKRIRIYLYVCIVVYVVD